MINKINQVITDTKVLSQRYILRNGFEFRAIDEPANVYDAIVIKNPYNIKCSSPAIVDTSRTLKEQIEFINKHRLKKALIIADDISFITECPTLQVINIIPSNFLKNGFDYSPIYCMPRLDSLVCITEYGEKSEFFTTINYNKMQGIKKLGVSGKGHLGFNEIESLEDLAISSVKILDFSSFNNCTNLKRINTIGSGLKSLVGIDKFNKLEELNLSYERNLIDVSQIKSIGKSLKKLSIENCAKIKDFSFIETLTNLENLELIGNNDLDNLDFLYNFKNLKTFAFSMNILNCDLSPCLKIPYVWSIRNKKTYNLADKDLPKG